MNSSWLPNVIAHLQDILSPAHCAHCWRLVQQRAPLCSACHNRIQPLVSHVVRGSRGNSWTVHAVGNYQEPLTSLIRAKHQRSFMSAHHLGQLMVQQITPAVLRPHDVIVPIPLHWQRYAWRGFNQAHVIANVIARHHKLPVAHLLYRSKRTAYQATTHSPEERTLNVHNAFCWNTRYNPQDYSKSRIVLIDDLMTTGSTLQEAVSAITATYVDRKLDNPPIIACVAARVV